MDEILTEFLTESHENLGQLDHDLIELEKEPHAPELLARIFRTFHTMKGVAGFLNFAHLEALAHAAEDLLSELRDGKLTADATISSALLATVDALRQMLAAIAADGSDGQSDHAELIARLEEFAHQRRDSESSEASIATALPTLGVPEAASSPPSLANVEVKDAPSNTEPRLPSNQKTASVAAPNAEERADNSGPSAIDSTIRVNVQLLDKLMNLVGELVLVRNQVLQCTTTLQESTFLGASQRLNLITTELQEGIMKTRMQPIGTIWNKFPRIVRDLAIACSKQVQIEMEGEETELDKTLIEAIRDPLTHIVRNAIDHGIESPSQRTAVGKSAEGRLTLRAFHESGQVIIEVGEDGAGIDLERVKARALERGLINVEQASSLDDAEAIKLIFMPGFSTAAKVTNISGRGVGMDVVKTNIEKIGGSVDVQTRRGTGTTLRIKIPLTLAIIPALVVTCAGDRYAIPQINLIELVRLESDKSQRRIEMVHGAPVYRLRGNLLPLVYLKELLQVTTDSREGGRERAAHIVVLQVGDQQFGLVVDEVNDTEEIMVKPLGKRLKGMTAFAGATIMGDGRVALILDVLGVVNLAGIGAEKAQSAHTEEQKSEGHGTKHRQRLLLCRAAGVDRIAMPLALVSRLEEFPRSAIERAAGRAVVSYRGEILPLVDLAMLSGGGSADQESELVQVVVFDDGRRRVGLVVGEIIDIVEDEAAAVQLSGRSDLIGSALISKKTTDLLDLSAVFAAASSDGHASIKQGETRPSAILLVDQSSFTRGLVRGYLELAGHYVIDASEADDAIAKLDRSGVELALVSMNLPGNGAVRERLRRRTAEAGIPLIGLADDRGEISPALAQDFDACHFKSDRQALLQSVAALLNSRRALTAEEPGASPAQG